MEIPKQYNPKETEDKWYEFWLGNEFFKSVPDDREPYTIVIPPPNVTGVLHMGHMLNNTIQDVLIRKARMQGYNACWVPGTDHASIATEAKVVQKLRTEGIKKSDLSRDEFLKHAWEWTDKHGGIILQQLKKLGASCDWDRTRFTMDENYYRSVIDVFIDLYEKGKIYRGKRMINWDPQALTALSDEEVIYKDTPGKLYHVRYQVVGSEEYLTIATTRPETILGDTAICIHPDDDRYKNLHGKQAIVPLVDREVPIILDDYVDMEFGTGCLKVTPAHDVNDYDLGIKHDLEIVDILKADGTLSQEAKFYVGEDRFDVRKKIVKDLDEKGHVVKIEDYNHNVGFSERTNVPIEPRLSLQWFVDMKELSKPALDNVMNDNISFFPSKFKNSYRNWMENIKDWCISRQLWWGHQIPAFYYGEGEDDFVVASKIDDALEKAKTKSGNHNLTSSDLKQDEDVMDTWFSSWLWPISVFDGFYDKKELDYYYPTNDLVTAPEIMFFWVARMIISGYEYQDKKPFKNVYYTGIVRDKQGRKMSKSLGNSPDPIELMNSYGADGVRVGMLLTSPAGNDLPFDEKLCEQGRNFSNKIWNALRLIKSWKVEEKPVSKSAEIAVQWFDHRFNEALHSIDDNFSKFRISDVLMTTYKLIWDEFCSWYLEMVKPPYGDSIDNKTYEKTISNFEKLLQVAHPFMPFITEEIWHLLRERSDSTEAIIVSSWPNQQTFDEGYLNSFEKLKEVISGVRNTRKTNSIPQKKEIDLLVKVNNQINEAFNPIISHLCNISNLSITDEKPSQAYSFIADNNEYFIPFDEEIDVEAEKEKLIKELDYAKGFLGSIDKKLSNERFVQNAPEQVVEGERKKQKDAIDKIKILEEKIASLEA